MAIREPPQLRHQASSWASWSFVKKYLRVRRPARDGRLISVDDPSAAILQTLVDCCKQKKLERGSERTKRKRDKVIIDQVTHEEERISRSAAG